MSQTGKLLEKIIVNRMELHLTEIGPDLSADQFGFRRNLSTVDVILEFKRLLALQSPVMWP